MGNNQTIRVAMMMSAPYSGATLFAILLSNHSLISCDGETFPTTWGKKITCSCGEAQVECDYYREVGRHMLADDSCSWNFDLFSRVPQYGGGRLINQVLGGFWLNSMMNSFRNFCCGTVPSLYQRDLDFLSAHERFFVNSLSMRKASVYVDGTKSFRRAEMIAASDRFDVKAVHLIRDGRGFCNSYIKNKKAPRSRLTQAARLWLKEMRKVDIYAARFPMVPLLHVRYEDLCKNSRKTLSEVCDFLELPYEESMEATDSTSYHIVGNRMRASFDGEVRHDLSWKTQLKKKEIDQITGIMEEGLKRFNYI